MPLEKVSCPSCGAEVPPTGRCPFCNAVVLLEGVAGRLLPSDMACPRCPGKEPLQGLEHDGVRADLCGKCHGAWFPLGALVEAIRRAAAGPRRKGEGARPPVHGGMEPVRYLRCPRCGGGMAREAFCRKPLVVLDRCPACGDWCDGGELGQLKVVARLHGADAALGRGKKATASGGRSLEPAGEDAEFFAMLRNRSGGNGIFPAGMRGEDGRPANGLGSLLGGGRRRRGGSLFDLVDTLFGEIL
jgi:Zn-finger nucleic acid-binding protein